MIAYKFLRARGRALFSRTTWPLPADGAPGAWIGAADGPIEACRNGVHACEVVDLPYWLGDELWEVELEGETQRGPDAVIARRGRLLRRIEEWNANVRTAFASACADRIATRLAKLGERVPTRAAQYEEQARTLAAAGYGVAAAYASALGFASLGEPEAELALFRAERGEQARVLGRLLGL